MTIELFRQMTGKEPQSIVSFNGNDVVIKSRVIQQVASDGVFIPESCREAYGGKERVFLKNSDDKIDPLFQKALEELYVPMNLQGKGSSTYTWIKSDT